MSKEFEDIKIVDWKLGTSTRPGGTVGEERLLLSLGRYATLNEKWIQLFVAESHKYVRLVRSRTKIERIVPDSERTFSHEPQDTYITLRCSYEEIPEFLELLKPVLKRVNEQFRDYLIAEAEAEQRASEARADEERRRVEIKSTLIFD